MSDLEDLGYQVKVGKNLAAGSNFHGYLCGSGKDRAEELNDLFADEEVDAIICIRGGYGSAQVMKYLDYELIRNHPKVFVGYSDITNLLNAFSEKCGFVTYHGPMVSSNILEHYDDYTRESFLKTIGDWEELEFANDTRLLHTITGGRAEGRLIGGNVTVVGRMMGTFYEPDSNGAIIFLEDVDELLRTRPEFNFDRWLTSARSWGDTEEEKNLLEYDATSLVTIWGADGDPSIFDYSWREWTGLIKGYYLPRWTKFYAMLQEHLDNGTTYSEEGLRQTHGREAFRANDFYSKLGDWELQFVSTPNKARTPIVQGDEIEIAGRMYKKYTALAKEYYQDFKADAIKDGKTYENLGE
jgi:hypothetical protein